MQYEVQLKCLTATPESRDEAIELNKVFRSYDPVNDPEGYGLFLRERHKLRKPVYKSCEDGFKGWYRVTAQTVGLEPYIYRLQEWVPDFDWPKEADLTAVWPEKVSHTHFIERVEMRTDNIVEVTGIVQVHKDTPTADAAEAHAVGTLTNYINERMMFRPAIPEFVECANGLYRRNPDYATGKQRPIEKRMSEFNADTYWNMVFAVWMADVATEAQRSLLADIVHYDGYKGPPIGVKDYNCYLKNPGGSCDYDGKGTMVSVLKPGDLRELLATRGRK